MASGWSNSSANKRLTYLVEWLNTVLSCGGDRSSSPQASRIAQLARILDEIRPYLTSKSIFLLENKIMRQKWITIAQKSHQTTQTQYGDWNEAHKSIISKTIEHATALASKNPRNPWECLRAIRLLQTISTLAPYGQKKRKSEILPYQVKWKKHFLQEIFFNFINDFFQILMRIFQTITMYIFAEIFGHINGYGKDILCAVIGFLTAVSWWTPGVLNHHGSV